MTEVTQPPKLAPWVRSQATHLLRQRGHAWLLQGPSGLGQYDLALELARGWLCEQPTSEGPCSQCAACHGIDVRVHADLCVLMPEVQMMALGWPLSEKAQGEIDDKKRKPSREIRVEAMREAIEFAQRTDARGRGKVLLIYPADRMNHVTANALLKTLEEPPGTLRVVLSSEAAHQLLPTVRSRCQIHTLQWPAPAQALEWLEAQGLRAEEGSVLLRAAGGRPEDALRHAREGRGPEVWRQLPRAMKGGQVDLVAQWPAAELIDGLQKLCHDLLAQACGAAPRYFRPDDLPPAPSLWRLTRWQKDLAREARHAEHPFHPGLMAEALVSRAQTTLN